MGKVKKNPKRPIFPLEFILFVWKFPETKCSLAPSAPRRSARRATPRRTWRTSTAAARTTSTHHRELPTARSRPSTSVPPATARSVPATRSGSTSRGFTSASTSSAPSARRSSPQSSTTGDTWPWSTARGPKWSVPNARGCSARSTFSRRTWRPNTGRSTPRIRTWEASARTNRSSETSLRWASKSTIWRSRCRTLFRSLK